MASDLSSSKDAFVSPEDVEHGCQTMARHLNDAVIFLLPCANMSLLRRQLLLPTIHCKGGVVTTDGSAATHCVVASSFDADKLEQLLIQHGISASCKRVSDSFLYQ